MGTILVGVDGSPDSKAALAWAAEEARRRGADLMALYAYDLRERGDPFSGRGHFPSGSTQERLGADAQRWREESQASAQQQADGILATAIHEAVGDAGDLTVTPLAVSGGRPTRRLLERTLAVDHLVVGARGRGGFRGLRLGSVAEKCVRHAACTVTVVRSPEREVPPDQYADD